jgi:DNA-binding NarL/FixJ family response regulator
MSRLYLVDDHAMVREAMSAMLVALGHEVLGEASEITPALAALARLEVDVVLLDMQLGGRSGLELLVALKQRNPEQAVIMLTMSRHSRDVSDALRHGALGYVLKDAGPEVLMKAIEEVAAGRRFVSEAVAEVALGALSSAEGAGTDALSPRERQVLVMVARGMTSAAIGEELHLSPKTVDSYRSRLMAKLKLNDVPAVVRWALREGLISLDDE